MSKVPSNLKYKGTTSKYLLKQLATKHLPDQIVNRSKKGFGIPMAKWINGPLKEQIHDTLLLKQSNSINYFNKKYINQILIDHINKKKDNRKLIWTLFILENWFSTHPH